MGIRTVRLDEETEKELAALRKLTGESISSLLKQGIRVYRKQILERGGDASPYEIYKRIDLGKGGWSHAHAKDSERALRDVIRRKLGR
jgi:hypothetical protein